ncbi:nucleotide-diphospho-sugar transferase [Chitinophaga sp. Cy-1792]|uniref:nucleotide-diphospho-sugar transferase n=1 Tax=Chitinophaga sp. Cy-1792 TaxID=2608339 RepID=UPI001420FEA8|nr:nucleotide-diphospho-sugar transferase [Chitinophaga sp. Cy-1792]NIG54439.1 nucleotide-diphospho-sugar transferase [Chitinophaga sp. Cy-1792]
MNTPVLILIFNRKAKSLELIRHLRAVKPRRIYIAADGPRDNRPEETLQCETTRNAVLEAIDWTCQITTLFRTGNLGCGKAVSSAISWFFEQEEEGIILEDDCMPAPSFFDFCTNMLHHYRQDQYVMHINGSNFQFGNQRGNASYYYSRMAHIWGWATWRRAWKYYDFSLSRYKHHTTTGLSRTLLHDYHWIMNGKLDTWDVQWFLSVWFNKGWVIAPNVSMVRNIGYDAESTHTQRIPPWFSKIAYGEITDIVHPQKRSIDQEADNYASKVMFSPSRTYLVVRDFIKTSPRLMKLYTRLTTK